MFVKRRDLKEILDHNDDLLRENTDFCEKLLEADKKNAFISEMIFEMMKRPEYKAPEFQEIFVELVTRMIEGLSKEEYEERNGKIRDFLEGKSDTLDFNDL